LLGLAQDGQPRTEISFRFQVPHQYALPFKALIEALAASLADLFQFGGALAETDLGAFLPTASIPSTALSHEERREVRAYGFKSTAPIYIGGESSSRGGGVVHVGGRPVSLPPWLFRLFLRLVVALHESGSGYVDRGTRAGGGLSDEGFYNPENLDRILSALRVRFCGAISDAHGAIDPLQFIQVEAGQLRLSTHRRCVAYERSALLEHPDDIVQQLAARLPEPDA
jgi:hypothetical protein